MTRPRRTDAPQGEKSQAEQARDRMLEGIRAIQVTAELVDAMMLAVELMLADQKRIMRDQGASTFLMENELWDGMATMLATVRGHMHDVGKTGEAIEIAGMAEGRAAA